MKQNLIKQFNLPSYIKGKSFAEASKAIEKRFKDRNDKISLDTKESLLKRLSEAQEAIKQPQETNEFESGGQMGAMNYLQAAQGLMSMGNNIFSESNVNADSQYGNSAKSAVGGALSGAQAGMSLGPIGAIAGGVLGGASSLIGSNKRNKAINEAKANKTHLDHNKAMNTYEEGGEVNSYDGIKLPSNFLDSLKLQLPNFTGSTDDLHNPTYNEVDILGSAGKTPNFNPNDVVSNNKNVSSETTTDDDSNSVINKAGKFLKDNYADILRYAPVGMNALQLSKLDKPQKERLNRLDNKYEKQYVDEAQLLNNINNNFNQGYLVDSSGGSQGRYAANARAAQLAKTKAISDAYLKGSEINRNEDKIEQQFDLGVDKVNLQQSNLENELDARNEGAYNTEKSRLIGQIGTDIGNIGREEKYKQMVKESGLCYDSRGRYICATGERVPDDVQLEDSTNENKYGGNIDSNGLFTTYLEKMLNKNK